MSAWRNGTFDAIEVAPVPAVALDERVDDADAGAGVGQRVHEVAADEPGAAGDDTRGAAEVIHGGPGRHGRPLYDPTMDEGEYQRLVDATESHWWFRATSRLLEQLLADHVAELGPEADARWTPREAPAPPVRGCRGGSPLCCAISNPLRYGQQSSATPST